MNPMAPVTGNLWPISRQRSREGINMLVLGIETATLVCGVALLNDERLCGEFAVNVHKTHSTRLLPLIDNLVREAGFTPASLDAVAVSSGPGSFTGLRIGLATAKGISFALGRP